MESTQTQYDCIAHVFPKHRGNVSISNRTGLTALLSVAEHGCTWRGLPAHCGNWHPIDTRMNRWAQSGGLDRGGGGRSGNVWRSLRRTWRGCRSPVRW